MTRNAYFHQYLSENNRYQRYLLSLAAAGTPFIVTSTDESTDPFYEGYATEDEALAQASRLNRSSCYGHAVFRLQQDEDGDWFTDWKHL